MTVPARPPQVLALIPARGGSKGIPRKNVMVVAGKPLIAHSIALALASACITRTIVSTDDEEIAAVAVAHGADVPFRRPPELAGDLSSDLDVFRHALAWLRDREGYRCDLVVHLRPTAPARRVEVVDLAIRTLLAHPDADSLRSVSLPKQTPYKMWRIVGEHLEPLLSVPGLEEAHSRPRQELPDVYWQNGYVDIVRPDVVLERGRMAGARVLPFIIDEPVPDCDYPEDLPRLEAALAALARGGTPDDRAPMRRHSA
jgi:CMP-N,N'-diacetyllegionaminic acid synthase